MMYPHLVPSSRSDLDTCVCLIMTVEWRNYFVLTVCFYTDLTSGLCHFSCCGLWMVAFFAIWKYFFNLSLQAKQWRLRVEDNGWDTAAPQLCPAWSKAGRVAGLDSGPRGGQGRDCPAFAWLQALASVSHTRSARQGPPAAARRVMVMFRLSNICNTSLG